MNAILKLLRTISPTTADTLPSKLWNIATLVAALAFGIVLFACRLGIDVPGADCSVIQAAERQP